MFWYWLLLENVKIKYQNTKTLLTALPNNANVTYITLLELFLTDRIENL